MSAEEEQVRWIEPLLKVQSRQRYMRVWVSFDLWTAVRSGIDSP